MDVSPRPFHRVWMCALLLIFSACGNRFDLATERGRQARIDEANAHLSRGECTEALTAITPLYESTYVDDEVRLVTASAYACAGTFNMLTMMADLAGAQNFFSVVAKTMKNAAGDNARTSMYRATDVLTSNNYKLEAVLRENALNNYMVFIQLGVMGAILRNYGAPGADGSQGTPLIYDTAGSPVGEMSDEDACALAAAFSIISNSFSYSTLNDSDTTALTTSLNEACVAAGQASCSRINKVRSGCDGANAASVVAAAVVSQINARW